MFFEVYRPTKSGHFAPAYLGGRNKLRASLEFLYGISPFIQILFFPRKRKKNYIKLKEIILTKYLMFGLRLIQLWVYYS